MVDIYKKRNVMPPCACLVCCFLFEMAGCNIHLIYATMQKHNCQIHKLLPAFKVLLIVSSSTFYNSIISCFDVIRMPQVPEGSQVQFHVSNEYLYTVLPFLAASFKILINSLPHESLAVCFCAVRDIN